MSKSIASWFKKNRVNVLVILLAVIVAGGLGWWRYYSSHQPQPLSSSAHEDQPHWRPSQIPFNLNLLNHASKSWAKSLTVAAKSWSNSGSVNFNIIPSGQAEICDVYPESMNFCSWNEADGWLYQMVYIQGPGDPHIISSAIAVNDAYLSNSESEYSAPAWRNYLLCQSFGWTMGMSFDFDAPDGIRAVESCMDVYGDSKTVANLQNPDTEDISEFVKLYDHNDDDSSSAISYKVKTANSLWKQKKFGNLVQNEQGGIMKYEQDLGDGYKMVTAVQQVSAK
jgi:hypothetical protein